MKAAFFRSPYNLEIVDDAIPEVGKDEVLIRVKYVGLCGTDLDIYENKAHFEVKYPTIGGHEFTGIVEKTGENVNCIKVGDRIVGDALVSCGKCVNCTSGDFYRCKFLKSVGTSWPFHYGAFREFTVMPERHVFKIPEGLPMLEATLTEPSVIARASMEKISINAGDVVLVAGTGAIGMFSAQYSKLKGAGMVILTGRNDIKLQIAKKTGIDFVINIKKEDLNKKLYEITEGRPINVCVEASGNIEALEQLINLAGRSCRLTVPGSYHEKFKEMDFGLLASKDIIISVLGALNRDDFQTMLWLIKCGRIDTKSLITEIYDFDNLEEAIKLHLNPNNSIKTIIRVDKGPVE